jgi:hypothetical protein
MNANELTFTSNMTTPYIVIIKDFEEQMEDYYGADELLSAQQAFDTAVFAMLTIRQRREWVALVQREQPTLAACPTYTVKEFRKREGVTI